MTRGLNRTILAGRLIADPEVRYTKEETAVCHFKIGVSHSGKTDPVSCVAWGKLAKICGEYLKKGRMVAVEGRLNVRNYTDKKGQKRSSTEIVIENMQMLDSKFYNATKKGGDSVDQDTH